MKVGFLITARLKSSRLKLKLLLDLNGYTVIERVIQRAKLIVGCDEVVLCTSGSGQDLPLLRTASTSGIYYFSGHPDDVLQRLLDASTLFDLDYFVGATADNPLFSIYHANLLVDMVRQNPGLDFAYTTGMPIGVNVYVMNVKALRTVCTIKKQIDTEIWGYLVRRPEVFNLEEIKVNTEYVRGYRLTLDEINDYYLFKELHRRFPKEGVIDVLDAYSVLDANPDIAVLNENVVQRDLDEGLKTAIDDYYRQHFEEIKKIKDKIYGI